MSNFKGYKCTYRFNAYHNTLNMENEKHLHTFWVNVYIECKNKEFTKFDVYEFQIKKYFNKFKGTYLNNIPVFKDNKPTLENMCLVFYEGIHSIFNELEDLEVVKLELSDGPLKSVSVGELIIAGSTNLLIEKELFEKYIKNSGKGML